MLSALQLPFFVLRSPSGFGVLTTTGRRTGKTRRRCIRAIRRGDRAYVVAIKGVGRTAWAKNIRANPDVRLRLQGRTLAGVARELTQGAEREEAMRAYCETVNPFDFLECAMWQAGRPTRPKIRDLHHGWFERGTPLVVELR